MEPDDIVENWPKLVFSIFVEILDAVNELVLRVLALRFAATAYVKFDISAPSPINFP